MERPKRSLRGTVVANKLIKGSYYLLEMNLDGPIATPEPGRFLMLKVTSSNDPLLRRPFGVHDFLTKEDGRTILKILYRVCGRGTGIMSNYSRGVVVDMLGPLGRGFAFPKDIALPIIMAGGIGGAPLMYLARKMTEAGLRPAVYIGGNTEEDILGASGFRGLGLKVSEATMDGSRGYHGTVVDLLERDQDGVDETCSLFTCGPWPMLNRLAVICRQRKWTMQATVDAYMACGMGLCLGCAVKKADGDHKEEGYHMVCRDGPVFSLEDLAWDSPI